MPEITRHATTGPSDLHWNKVCSSHSYSLNQIWTGGTSIYVNEVVPHSSAVSLPGETTVLCMYFRPKWATSVTSLELLWEPETPTWVLLSSAQQLQVKEEHVTFTYICRKCPGMLKVSTRGEYGTGSFLTRSLLQLPYVRIYIKPMMMTLNIPGSRDRWQWTQSTTFHHRVQSPVQLTGKMRFIVQPLIPEACIHFFKVLQLHNNNDCQKLRLQLLWLTLLVLSGPSLTCAWIAKCQMRGKMAGIMQIFLLSEVFFTQQQ